MDTPLKKLRLARNKTLKEVADGVGTDTGNISRIENGKQRAIDLAPKLVEFFGEGSITESQILYPERYPPPKRRERGARA